VPEKQCYSITTHLRKRTQVHRGDIISRKLKRSADMLSSLSGVMVMTWACIRGSTFEACVNVWNALAKENKPERRKVAAQDTFDGFNASLSEDELERISDFSKAKREEVFASRSEDARVRLVHEYIKEVHELLFQVK
jgi:hypothetical protein